MFKVPVLVEWKAPIFTSNTHIVLKGFSICLNLSIHLFCIRMYIGRMVAHLIFSLVLKAVIVCGIIFLQELLVFYIKVFQSYTISYK